MTETPEAQVAHFAERMKRVRTQIGKVVVGQQAVVDGVLTCLLAGGHGLLQSVPGLGKTVLVRTLAQSLDLRFSRIQFTPDLMPADILGTQVIDAGERKLSFQPGPVFAHVVLADEINRTSPKTQSALLEAMQERSVTVANTTHQLEAPFVVLGTQNPLEMEGTYPLPEAQLDRFMFKLHVPFPDRAALREILDRTAGAPVEPVEPVLTRDEVLAMQATVREVAVAEHVRDYAVRLLQATHPELAPSGSKVARFVRFGASPRGAQSCLLGAKVRALFDGRVHVAVEDIREVAHTALRHRVILNFEGEAEGISTDDLLDDILTALPERAD